MRHLFTSMLLLALCTFANAQVKQAEYFIDNDPGFGKAAIVNFVPGTDLTNKFNIPLNKVVTGMHTLYLRVRDAQGRWSLTNSSIFFVCEVAIKNKVLQKAEYYVDNDPGLGKATAVTMSANQKDASVNFKVDVKSLSAGMHTLNVRMLDNANSWSLTTQRMFVVKDGALQNIVSLKYYFIKTGFTSDTYTYSVPVPSPSISLNFKANLSALTTGQDYTMQIYAVLANGAQSEIQSKTFKVISAQTITFPAIATKIFGDPDFDPGATTTSALPIIYTTSNPAVATIVNGKLRITGAGTVIITASQAGNQDYTAALPVSNNLVVNKASQTITFPSVLVKNVKDPDFNPSATASSGLPVIYTSSNLAVLTLVNGQLHIAGVGTSTITATQAGNANYLPAASVSQDVQVIFSLPANNFTLSTTSVSCKGNNNGEINITAASNQNYTATVTAGTISTTYPFAGTLSVKNLPAGTYSVCVTIAGYAAFKQCFDVVVTEPKDLSVYAVVNPTLSTLNLHLEGGSTYNINLNGVVTSTSKSDVIVPLAVGRNTIKITTNSLCQGIYEKVIDLPPGITAYPNPFDRVLTLSVGKDLSSAATVEVFDMKGTKVYAGKNSISQGQTTLDLAALAPGNYVLKLVLNNAETHIKIIKK
ncbi:MAG: T9SS type A sorting domain-containing protein [Sphingobacteriaceae bacterium]|nr:MAG: T9SS type A sorting domain-containing protein [Sphingobacteriaceae bacterium]